MLQQQRRLPALSPLRRRRLEARLPAEILAARADVPLASLSRHERGEKPLSPEQLDRVEAALVEAERGGA